MESSNVPIKRSNGNYEQLAMVQINNEHCGKQFDLLSFPNSSVMDRWISRQTILRRTIQVAQKNQRAMDSQ